MQPLPSQDLRSNLGTWAVPTCLLPAVGNFLHDALPNEPFDPHFRGQRLETTYFDTANYDLRKARVKKDQYLTLRVRCYRNDRGEVYALSAKTEDQKFRVEICADAALLLLTSGVRDGGNGYLPPDLVARLLELAADAPVVPVVTVTCRRYAVEDEQDRYTLDTDVRTDRGKCLPFGVLEFKSTHKGQPPGGLPALALRPIKLSKVIWALEI